MSKLRFFVEGLNDINFIRDFVKFHYNIDLDTKRDIIKLGGKTKLKSYANKFLLPEDGKNVVLFDADGNYAESLEYLETQKVALDIEFDTFLFPNDTDTGEIEDLLENIIPANKRVIMDCWHGFETCIETNRTTIEAANNANFCTIPANKTKIYAYLEVLHGETDAEKEKVKDKNRDFKDPNLWDMNHSYLAPLKEFLDEYFLNP